MIRTVSVALLALAVSGCGESPQNSGYAGAADRLEEMTMAAAPPPPMAPASMPAMEFAKGAPGYDIPAQNFIQPDPGGGGGGGAGPAAGSMMAYTYGWNFSVPTENMQGLQAAHKKLCEDAGPANCYVTNSSLEAIGKVEGSYGSLSLRATEAWVDRFEQGVGESLKPFGGSIYSSSGNAEDLSTQIVDFEARLKSMIAHRDALQKMIEDKPGRLSDLLEIQQALAQAQGDIDSSQSMLAALKLRVSMSVLTFNYQPEYAAASNSIWRPISDAFGDFGPSFARTVAAIVHFIAAVLPLAIIVGLVAWLLMTVLRWRRRSRTMKPPVSPAKTGA